MHIPGVRFGVCHPSLRLHSLLQAESNLVPMIAGHMNADHKDSIIAMLECYGDLMVQIMNVSKNIATRDRSLALSGRRSDYLVAVAVALRSWLSTTSFLQL